MNKSPLAVTAETGTVAMHETWIQGSVEQTIGTDSELASWQQPSVRQSTNFTIWYHDENRFNLEISRVHRVQLVPGFSTDKHRIAEELLNADFTREELRILATAISDIFAGINSGDIISREEEYRINRDPEEEEE